MKRVAGFFLLFATHISLCAQEKINAAEMLRQAGLKRMPWAQMSFDASLADSGNGGESITAYRVFINHDNTLVACTAPAVQKGNLVLLLNHEMWFYFKSTAQPAKITPLQRLSGAVSLVDITRLNWAADYIIDSVASTNDEKEKVTCLLYLHAASQDISYRRIHLWVTKKSNRPFKADIYLDSEKLYKTLLFTKYQVIDGKEINSQIQLIDHFNKDRKSVINFLHPRPETHLPEDYFMKEKLPAVSKAIIAAN